MHQAFENLLRNAIKYTNNEGAINIKLQHRNNHVHFTIQNDGQPMTKEAQLHIFDRFYKVNSNDTSNGLGLSITQAIVQLHHGHIEVRVTILLEHNLQSYSLSNRKQCSMINCYILK